MVDRPGFGRRRSLTIFFGMSGVLHLLFTFNRLTLFSSGSRFFMKLCFQMLYPFTTESYGTLNRTIGFGFCAAMGRVGSTIMPYILFPLLDLSSYTVFLSFVFVSFMGMLLSNMVPRDTLGVSLDENKKDRYHVMDS
jgi:putative MFS transporter